MLFKDRQEGGKRLANELQQFCDNPDVVVLGLPRGGVVTAYEIADKLHVPLDVICPRKIGAPSNPELAIGAVTETGEGIFNEDLLAHFRLSEEELLIRKREAQAEAARRSKLYRQNRPALALKNKIVILADDGLATGATMKAAIRAVIGQYPQSLVVAVPVSPPDTLEEIGTMVDTVVCLFAPFGFQAVGQFYQHFDQTSDEEVIRLLSQSATK